MSKSIHRKLQKYYSLIVFLIYVIGVIILTFRTNTNVGDDVASRNITQGFTLLEWVQYRYNSWSARFIQEGLGYMLIWHPTLWRIMTIIVMVSIPICFSYIIDKNSALCFACTLFLLYPINQMAEAGWICTTNTYLYPAMFGVLSCTFLYAEYYNRIKHKTIVLVAFCLSILIASDHELLAAFLALILIAFLIVYYHKNKKISKLALAGLLLNIANIVFILLSPGNGKRMASEINSWFPEFANFDLLDKMTLGIIRVYRVLLEEWNPLFSILCVLVMVCGFSFLKNPGKKIVSALPLLVVLARNTRYNSLHVNDVREIIYSSDTVIFPLIFVIISVVSIALVIFWSFNEKQSWLYLIPLAVLFGGVATVVAMGLSPTIYASGFRTTIFLYFGLIYLNLVFIRLIQQRVQPDEKRHVAIVVCLAVTCIILSASNINYLLHAL